MKVLLVEDNPGDARLLKETLADAATIHVEFTQAERLSIALEKLSSEVFDVILLDLSLPDAEGLETITRAQECAPDVPIVVLTGLDDQGMAVKAVRQGAQDYLIKGQGDGHLLLRAMRYAIERKRGEDALRQANERVRAVIQNSPVAIYTLDPDFRVKSWNPAAERMFGWTAEEVLDRRLPTVPPEAQEGWFEELERVKRGEWENGKEARWVRKDGKAIDVAIWTTMLHDSSGGGGFVVAVTDITERRHLEERLRQSQRIEAVGRLAGGVAHDFNNLLTIIAGYSDFLLGRVKPGDPLRRNVEEIKKAADRAAALTNQLLAFSRRQVLQPKVLDLNDIVADMNKMLRRLIPEDIDLVVTLDPRIGRVKADPGQIEQVIVNLVVNAREAMPSGGKVIIETSNKELDESYANQHVGVTPGRYVMLSVSDTGHGMSAETMEHIFEPFFTTKHHGRGTGLGLSTVYGIVRQSEGHIGVYSEPSHGSTFKIYLPLVEEAAELRPAPPIPVAAPGVETVLVAEDEETVRVLVRDILKDKGYTVIEARNGGEALDIAKQFRGRIDLLLTDVVMPVTSGGELAERLVKVHPETKVLFMSGYTDDAIVRNGMLKAGKDFLQKPFTPNVLARKVRTVLDGGEEAEERDSRRSTG